MRRHATRALALCVAAVVALVAVHAGRSYVWCVPMQRPMPRCCLEAKHELLLERRGPVISADKSEVRSLGTLPPARDGGGGKLEAPPPALLASRGDPQPTAAATALPLIARAAVRPRPLAIGPPAASERCVLLQVFHC